MDLNVRTNTLRLQKLPVNNQFLHILKMKKLYGVT